MRCSVSTGILVNDFLFEKEIATTYQELMFLKNKKSLSQRV